MKREILFRGKSFKGEWIYGYLIAYEGSSQIGVLKNPDVMDFVKVKPNTVGQFTGLYDKNGKRIFEGDVVKRTVNMRYYADCDGIETKIHNIEYFGIELLPFSECGFYMEEYEVIGNVHDNPELL